MKKNIKNCTVEGWHTVLMRNIKLSQLTLHTFAQSDAEYKVTLNPRLFLPSENGAKTGVMVSSMKCNDDTGSTLGDDLHHR